MLFPVAEDGSQLIRSTGGYVSTLTNLDTGASIRDPLLQQDRLRRPGGRHPAHPFQRIGVRVRLRRRRPLGVRSGLVPGDRLDAVRRGSRRLRARTGTGSRQGPRSLRRLELTARQGPLTSAALVASRHGARPFAPPMSSATPPGLMGIVMPSERPEEDRHDGHSTGPVRPWAPANTPTSTASTCTTRPTGPAGRWSCCTAGSLRARCSGRSSRSWRRTTRSSRWTSRDTDGRPTSIAPSTSSSWPTTSRRSSTTSGSTSRTSSAIRSVAGSRSSRR